MPKKKKKGRGMASIVRAVKGKMPRTSKRKKKGKKKK